MKENPKLGDVVRLNSGGPKMTVLEIGTTLVTVMSMLPEGEFKTVKVPAEALILLTPAEEAV